MGLCETPRTRRECGGHRHPGSWGKGGKRPASGLWKRRFALADKGGGTLTVPVDSTSRATNRDRDALAEPRAATTMEPRDREWLKDWMQAPKKAAFVLATTLGWGLTRETRVMCRLPHPDGA